MTVLNSQLKRSECKIGSIKVDYFLSDTSLIHKPVDSKSIRTRGQSNAEK